MDEDDLAALIEGEETGAPVAERNEGAERISAVPESAEVPDAGGPGSPPAPKASEDRPGHVPLSALRDEREKRQAAERRLAEREATPDPARDAQLWALRMDLSRELAVSRHGEEEADALQQWGVAKCDADPAFNAQVYRSRNPYEFIRQARQREQLLAEVKPEDLDDYRAWKAAKASQDRPSTVNAGGPGPTAPPRSLADAPNAGGAGAHSDLQIGPGTAFSQTIRR